MNRYTWDQEQMYLYPNATFSTREWQGEIENVVKWGERVEVPKDYKNTIFVNILEIKDVCGGTIAHVKLFYADGFTIHGWTMMNNAPIDITNKHELFDGRFNQ